MKRFREWFWSGQATPAVFLIVGSMVIFGAVLGARFVNWDDERNILENPLIRSVAPGHLWSLFGRLYWDRYTPLTWVSWAFNFAWGALEPFGYHLVNLVLHGMGAGFLFLLIRKVLLLSHQEKGIRADIAWAAFLGAAFFAWHPLRAEPVAWVTGRRYVLSAAFLLPSILVYLKGWEKQSKKNYFLSLSLFAAAVLSNELASAAAGVFLILDWWLKKIFDDRKRESPSWVKLLDWKIPFLAVAAASMVLAAASHQTSGQVAAWESYGALYRISQAVYAVGLYLVKTLVPIGLSPLYSLPRKEYWNPLAPVFIACAVGVFGTSIAAFVFRRRFYSWSAVWVSYLILLSPTLGFALSRSFAYDRYSYLSMMPWSFLISAGLLKLMRWKRGIVLGLGVMILMGLGGLSFKQTFYWKDSVSLWSRAVSLEPGSHHARLNLAQAYERLGSWDNAIKEYQQVLHLYPDHPLALQQLGNILNDQNNPQEAVIFYQRALEKYQPEPIYRDYVAVTLVNTSVALLKMGQKDQAIQAAAFAVQMKPDFPEAHYQLGYGLASSGRFEAAIGALEASLSLKPQAKTYFYLGNAYEAIRQRPKANLYWQKALEMDQLLSLARKNLEAVSNKK